MGYLHGGRLLFNLRENQKRENEGLSWKSSVLHSKAHRIFLHQVMKMRVLLAVSEGEANSMKLGWEVNK